MLQKEKAENKNPCSILPPPFTPTSQRAQIDIHRSTNLFSTERTIETTDQSSLRMSNRFILTPQPHQPSPTPPIHAAILSPRSSDVARFLASISAMNSANRRRFSSELLASVIMPRLVVIVEAGEQAS